MSPFYSGQSSSSSVSDICTGETYIRFPLNYGSCELIKDLTLLGFIVQLLLKEQIGTWYVLMTKSVQVMPSVVNKTKSNVYRRGLRVPFRDVYYTRKKKKKKTSKPVRKRYKIPQNYHSVLPKGSQFFIIVYFLQFRVLYNRSISTTLKQNKRKGFIN